MDLLRTPDARFASLPDYPFEPRFLQEDRGDVLAEVLVKFLAGI